MVAQLGLGTGFGFFQARSAFSGLINQLGISAACAYSVRRLSGTSWGTDDGVLDPLVRLRRDNDNDEENFTYDLNGDLDTSAISTWLGANNAFLVTWFDQSGGGHDATQATAANQAAYIASGINSLPAFDYDGNDYNAATGGAWNQGVNATLSVVLHRQTSGTRFAAGTPYDGGAAWDAPFVAFQIGTTATAGGIFFINIAGTYRGFNAATINNNTDYVVTLWYDGTTRVVYVDGTSYQSVTT